MRIKVVRNVFEENDSQANEIRRKLRARRQSMFNFMSSPGSGKTTLLQRLIPELLSRDLKVGVIEGDITTTNDADRLAPLGIPIAQINTEYFGGDCHLAANVVLGGIEAIEDSPLDLLLIENVGNLVCPAEFDTGSDVNIVLLSVTEGEDKPLKYPLMFQNSQVALINKAEIAKILEVDVELMKRNMRQVNPKIEIFETAGKTGLGIAPLADRLLQIHSKKYA